MYRIFSLHKINYVKTEVVHHFNKSFDSKNDFGETKKFRDTPTTAKYIK